MDDAFTAHPKPETRNTKPKPETLNLKPNNGLAVVELPFVMASGAVSRGEKMLYSGTDPESYMTEYTSPNPKPQTPTPKTGVDALLLALLRICSRWAPKLPHDWISQVIVKHFISCCQKNVLAIVFTDECRVAAFPKPQTSNTTLQNPNPKPQTPTPKTGVDALKEKAWHAGTAAVRCDVEAPTITGAKLLRNGLGNLNVTGRQFKTAS
jgi:hypothetical protein